MVILKIWMTNLCVCVWTVLLLLLLIGLGSFDRWCCVPLRGNWEMIFEIEIYWQLMVFAYITGPMPIRSDQNTPKETQRNQLTFF